MSEAAAPPPGGDENRGPRLIAVYWVMNAVSVAVICLRLYGRRLIRGFGVDDYMMIFTSVLSLVLAGLVTYMAQNGGGRHLYYLTPQQQMLVIKFNWIAQVFGIMAFAAVKISVSLLIMRIITLNNVWMRYVLWFVMGSMALFSVLDCIFNFVQCDPPRALWEPNIPHKCWDSRVQSGIAIFNACWNIAMDFLLASLPVTLVWNTTLSVKKRIATCALLGLGPLAGAFGIVKTSYLVRLNARSDLTWETYPLYVWTSAELFVAMMCGSIPPIKPVFDRFFSSKPPRSSSYYAASSRWQSQRSGYLWQGKSSRSQEEYDLETLRSSPDHHASVEFPPNNENIHWVFNSSSAPAEK